MSTAGFSFSEKHGLANQENTELLVMTTHGVHYLLECRDLCDRLLLARSFP